MMIWEQLNPKAHGDHLGFIPSFLDEHDLRTAREQFEANYIGGWRPMRGFHLYNGNVLKYSNDPPLKPLFTARFRDEKIFVYLYGWVMVKQADDSWEVARMD